MVVVLKERGVSDITIGEGIVTHQPDDRKTPAHAFETLGYNKLRDRYGVKSVSVMERPFQKVDLGDGIELNFNADAVNSDFLVDLPAMKTHNQTVLSLGIKNLKGLLNLPSRKKCHSMEPGKDLHYYVARLADRMPPMLTLLDGIYTLERGPSFDGRVRRSNLLVASRDILSADLVGCKILGHEPAEVPHLVHAAANRGRPLDLSDVEVVGEKIEAVASRHEWAFDYTVDEQCSLPVPMAKEGLKGIFYRKYDLSMCTYCSGLNGLVLSAIRYAWKGKPWDRIEVLTGKSIKPAPGMHKTILLGQCIYQANKDNPDIKEMIAIRGCPPKTEDVVAALQKAGIEVDPTMFANVDLLPGYFLPRYAGRPEYNEAFHRVD
jgi:uncharacterized protein (DUF362 family)